MAELDFAPASADASFRRYFRLRAQGRSWIIMDAPPEREDCRPFVQVAGLMQAAGVHVPEILAQDLAQGYLLLGDLGQQLYIQALTADNADALFDDAMAALLRWQLASRPSVLPDYDEALLRRELALFPDWFVAGQLGRSLDAGQSAAWNRIVDLLVASASAQAPVYVHRDFMPRNLMIAAPNPGVLDFQDAVYGPATYDLVCLFKDAFLSWPEERFVAWTARYHQRALAAGLPFAPDTAEFRRQLDWMGLQRHLKVLGIFARLRHRDGKAHYVADAPRFVRYVRAVARRYAALLPLLQLFDALDLQD
jgi:aminoglycoside/choline kinase family phosphotransferase